jgi:hypothetical protein
MPRSKPDLSRLVMLNYTPSEAILLAALLETVRQRAHGLPREAAVVADSTLKRIDLQLKHLKWPDRNKAPYPV